MLDALAVAVAPAPVHCRTSDPRIVEASSLVDLGRVLVTANDSGDSARVFVLDARTCRTVGVTTYDGTAVDVEAMAPAGPHAVWVGDVGDNGSVRTTISVVRVPVARGDHHVAGRRYALAHPDGAHDAESLVRDGAGRLYVATKSLMGGSLYAAPRRLRPGVVNRLVKVGPVGVLATDAAMAPDHRHLVVRDYLGARVLAFPGLRVLAALALPSEPQGEGISVGRTGRVLVDTEGVGQLVQQVRVPAAVRRLLAPPAARPTPSPTNAPSASPSASPTAGPGAGAELGPARAVALGVGVLALAVLAGLLRRRRRP